MKLGNVWGRLASCRELETDVNGSDTNSQKNSLRAVIHLGNYSPLQIILQPVLSQNLVYFNLNQLFFLLKCVFY